MKLKCHTNWWSSCLVLACFYPRYLLVGVDYDESGTVIYLQRSLFFFFCFFAQSIRVKSEI